KCGGGKNYCWCTHRCSHIDRQRQGRRGGGERGGTRVEEKCARARRERSIHRATECRSRCGGENRCPGAHGKHGAVVYRSEALHHSRTHLRHIRLAVRPTDERAARGRSV